MTSLAYPPVSQPDAESYDYRYEFSETRKVLEEFFKAENEFPASSSLEQRGETGGDLDYSLTRLQSNHSGSSYVAQRLADAEADVVPVVPLPPYSRDLLDLVDTIPPLPNIRYEFNSIFRESEPTSPYLVI